MENQITLFVLSRKRGQLFQTSRALKASANTADANIER